MKISQISELLNARVLCCEDLLDSEVCSACGSQMVEIGKDVRRTLQMKPAQFRIREDVYYTCACKNCELETG